MVICVPKIHKVPFFNKPNYLCSFSWGKFCSDENFAKLLIYPNWSPTWTKHKLVKEDGSAVRLTEKTIQLTRSLIYGSKISRIVPTFSKRTCIIVEGQRLFICITKIQKASKINSASMLYLNFSWWKSLKTPSWKLMRL